MRGSIRTGVGFLIAFGAVGGLEADPNSSVIVLMAVACVGLAIMATGVSAMKGNNV